MLLFVRFFDIVILYITLSCWVSIAVQINPFTNSLLFVFLNSHLYLIVLCATQSSRFMSL